MQKRKPGQPRKGWKAAAKKSKEKPRKPDYSPKEFWTRGLRGAQ